jgi:hypothetical protein
MTTCEPNEAQEYLLKLLKDHAINPSTDGLRYGMWIEGGWKKLWTRSGQNFEVGDIDHVIALLDSEDFWRKVWWRKVASEDITLQQKKDWICRACDCEIVGPCETCDDEGKPTPETYPKKRRVCKKCYAEFPTLEVRNEHQTRCIGIKK